jgi:hypothetical protein
VSIDLLDGGRPKRLILSQGRWYLEMTRLVSAGDGVFQPRSHRVEGKGTILEALRRSKHGRSLVDAAARLVANGDGADASFDAVEGAWVPSRLAPSYIKQLARTDVRTPAEAALIAELTLLRASHEGLMARVARLERLVAKSSDLSSEAHPFATPGAHTHRELPYAASLPEPDELPAHEEPAHDGEEDPAAAFRDEAAPAGASVASSDDPDAGAVLRFPPLSLVTDALRELSGQEIPLKEMKGAGSDWVESPSRYQVAWLVDDMGDPMGAILCDFVAVARLGGAMLSLSQADIETHAAAEQPSEEIVNAASDLAMTIGGLIGDVEGNPRVRAKGFLPLEEASDWLQTPGRLLVSAHPGGGTVAFVSR